MLNIIQFSSNFLEIFLIKSLLFIGLLNSIIIIAHQNILEMSCQSLVYPPNWSHPFLIKVVKAK